jgi:lipoprotein-releasing system permease protein
MNLPLFIARRYFISTRKKSFINLISLLSMAGVAVATAALVIVLSVFNGLQGVLQSFYNSFDPELKVELVRGKSFEVDSVWIRKLEAIEGVEIVTEVIEDYAYIRYRESEMVAIVKGVGDNFVDHHRLDSSMVEGKLKLHDKGVNYAILGQTIKHILSASLEDNLYPIQVFYIKNLKASTLDPSQLYAQRNILPGGVFSIEKNYDENYIFMPLDFVQDLLNYGNKRTSLEIKTKKNVDVIAVQASIKKVLGNKFNVLTNQEQHKDIFKLLQFEKLFTFLALSLLITISAINIFFSLMMLTLEKKKDIGILGAMGANESLIKNIFLAEGALIAFIGASIGLLAGALICIAQDQFGLVGMGVANGVIADYPVKMNLMDFVYTSLVIVAVTFVVSIYPAISASRGVAQKQH